MRSFVAVGSIVSIAGAEMQDRHGYKFVTKGGHGPTRSGNLLTATA